MARNNLLKNYHRLAEDALLGDRSSADDPILSASANGQWERVENILEQHRTSVDARGRDTGDTPLIAAARNGHANVVKLLLRYGADITLQNDLGETALEVASDELRKLILSSVTHEGRTMSTAQALLQSAWLGDSVSVKKHLSGSHYIDVNCKNNDGLTPVLLVTRDIALFEQVHNAMTSEYNPVKVLEDLIEKQADINACDKQGRSALHLVATSDSIHAKRMVSLLVKHGSNSDSLDSRVLAPLHMASSQGHMSIIVALVEEGGADINSRGGEQKDTPLILTARSGHNEVAKYLLTKGADVTLVNENGDTALSVAKTQSMIQILKEAWTERAQEDKREDQEAKILEVEGGGRSPVCSSPSSPLTPQEKSCFLTERQMTKSFEYEDSDVTDHETLRADKPYHGSFPGLLPACSEAEADDEFEDDSSRRRGRGMRQAKHRAQIRANFEGSIPKRKLEKKDFMESPRRNSGDWKTKSLPKHFKEPGYSSIDDEFMERLGDRGSGAEEHVKPATGHQGDEQRREAVNRREEAVRGEGPRVKEHIGKEAGQAKEAGRGGVCESVEDGRQERNGGTGKEQKKNGGLHPKGILGRLSKHLRGGLHDRSYSQENLPTSSSGQQETKEDKKPILPGIKTTTAGKHKDLLAVKKSSLEHLPVLSHMQPVALVSVEVDRQRLHVQQFGPKDGRGHTQQTMTRSQSLSVVKPGNEHYAGGGVEGAHKKRNSTGSVLLGPELERAHGARVPLLPSVVAPHFEPHHASQHAQKAKVRGRLQPLSLPTATSTPHINITAAAHLSIVNEDSEGSSSDRTLTNSSEAKGVGAKLKASSSTPDTEAPRKPTGETTPTSTSPGQKFPGSNTLVHFAEANGSIPLSPIWNHMQYLRTDSETSSNSEYILSYIGQDHPPGVPDPPERKPGVDSGHGESDDEQVVSEGSEGEALQVADKEVLKWKRGRLLGRGAYGKVWEGLMDSAKMVAVKEVELDSDPDRAQAQFEKIQMEVDILRSLRHKNIVSYLGTSMHGSVVYIFMDFISGGSLQSILKRFGQLDEKTISHYTRQIVKGLDYLHTNGIVHRDIKGANIMVTSRGIVKLIDFGCAKKYCQEMSGEMHSVRGTPYWMAPEVICGQGYGRKSDIWSLGCTVHEMGTTKPPWAELPPESALFNIGLGTAVCTPPDHFSPDLRDFVFVKCLSRDQSLRPSAHELLEHKFLLMAKAHGPKQQ